MLLSLLDQAPRREGGPAGHALRDMQALARLADAEGFTRLWVAEHHALGSVDNGAPEVVLGVLAAQTTRLRVGSGGVLLPNHRPLHVAEQFRALEALAPGRVDLGVGRSEGALDPATVRAFARAEDNAHGGGYEEQLDELLAFGEVAPLPDGHPLAGVRAVPRGVPLPPVFLLGSSPGSGANAGRRGLGYAFAAHTNPDGAAGALRAYREAFRPSPQRERPHAILAVKVMCGRDDEHAAALAAPQHLSMVQSRLGSTAGLRPVEEVLAHRWTAEERAAEARHVDVRADVVGGPERVRDELGRVVRETGADEVIAIVNTYDPQERLAACRRLARALELPAADGAAAAA